MQVQQAMMRVRDARLTPVQWDALFALTDAVSDAHEGRTQGAYDVLKSNLVTARLQAADALA